MDIGETIKTLNRGPDKGLSSKEAEDLIIKYGKNAIPEKHHGLIVRFLSYFWGPIAWMIEAASILSAALRHWLEFVIIIILLFVNASAGFWQEYKAGNAIAMLKRRLALRARALRDGLWVDIPAEMLVPGDVISIKLGNIIPADILLTEGDYISIDQSAITGESLPVDKRPGDIGYSGSVVEKGEMVAIVTATGLNTFFGKTIQLAGKKEPASHFRQAVLSIGNFLIFSALALIAVIIFYSVIIRREPFMHVLLFVLVLTVAAIPVALPAVLSVTMAVGAEKLAGLKAIVSRLVSIEEMAGIDILCADKTGTLTVNKLALGKPVLIHAESEEELMSIAALASEKDGGDSIDTAIIEGLKGRSIENSYKITAFKPFDPVSKRAEAEVSRENNIFKATKGAPQVILALTKPDEKTAKDITAAIDSMAEDGYRTLGVAKTDDAGNWRIMGLLSLYDPPRDDSARVIEETRGMGIAIKMLTGDHLSIAKHVAALLHLGGNIVPAENAGGMAEQSDGFAQVFPEHKYEIVKELQAAGHIVGMTGDGVNDAPALKRANIGIAVSGSTDAARAAADLILTAPGLSVITQAVAESRRIFERMNGYAIYRIAETIRVIIFMTLSIIIFNFYPVTAVMIIIIALLNDFPIMTIAYDNVPVPSAPARWDMPRVLAVSMLLGLLGVAASFLLFLIAVYYLRLPARTVQTLIFLKLLIAGHLTIFLTRNKGAIWQRPLPSGIFFNANAASMAAGTFAAAYGWLVPPLGWYYTLAVWVYSIAWLMVNSTAKITAYRILDMTKVARRSE